MNIKDSNKHFEKLSSFYSQVKRDGEINKIELDLLKSYVLSFYESITATASNAPQATTPAVETKTVDNEAIALAPIAVPVSPEPASISPIAEQAPSGNTAPKKEAKADKQVSSEYQSLFSLETGNEISDKLSMSPIKDVTKAMNINERIFTIKELFGGNQEVFDKTMAQLNGLASYDEASTFLSEEIVASNGWLDPSKTKKVKTFLKLIARKYL